MRKFIFGTDWWTDCDDCVALRLIARAHKAGEIELLGIGINGCMEYSAASVDGFLHLEGLTDIPLGIDRAASDFGGNPPYQKRLAPHAVRYRCNDDAEDAVRLYRRLLAAAQSPVEIIEVGYVQVIAAVLASGGDDISEKTGMELVQENVTKIWMMAGRWTEQGARENNFARNERTRAASAAFCKTCPVPVTFLGAEIGMDVITGGNLHKNDPLHLALCDHGSDKGRMSWDPMTALLALIGDEEKAGYDVVRGTARVDAETGLNYFTADEKGRHQYVVMKHAPEFYRDEIDSLIASK